MEQRNQEHEPAPEIAPRIYVASLADYNAGVLHGTWINADQDATDIHRNIHEMLGRSRQAVAEEWAIHDYEGFAGYRLAEYENIETITRIATGITRHGPAFASWIDYLGDTADERLEHFEDAHLGHYENLTEFADQWAEDSGLTEELVPEWARSYLRVDLDALARDLEIDLHIADNARGGIDVFDPRI